MKKTPTDLEKKRDEWRAKHPFTRDMTFEESLRLNEEFIRLFPMTREERANRRPVDVEFVL